MGTSRVGTVAAGGLVALIALLSAPLVRGTDVTISATLAGAAIPLSDIAGHHCHDGAYPEIRCFDDEPSRDADAAAVASEGHGAGWLESSLAPVARASGSYYVVWYQHANYGGASYMTALSHSDLTAIGWNDAISSFKSIDGQRPKWWEHASYGGATWQWAAGAWVSYVGDGANDLFSSVKNVP